MSLRKSILLSFFLIVVLTISSGIIIGYITVQQGLQKLSSALYETEIERIAAELGRSYSAAGSWSSAYKIIKLQNQNPVGEEEDNEGSGRFFNTEKHEEGSEQSKSHPNRIIITDTANLIIADNYNRLQPGRQLTREGDSTNETFITASGEVVGKVHLFINSEYLTPEYHGFLSTTLLISILGGLITAVVALIIAQRLTKRITRPVESVTAASRAIGEGKEFEPLETASNDEFGEMGTAFNIMNNSLQTQRELRRRLISDLAHELNTPLSVIRLEAKGMLDGMQQPVESGKHIIQETVRLKNLVQDLNWLAESDSGELQFNFEPASLADLLQEEVKRWMIQATAAGIEISSRISKEYSGKASNIQMDYMRLSLAFGNVFRNSIKYTSEHGKISVSLGRDNAHWIVKITDNGRGIEAEELPLIITRHYRAKSAQEVGISGMGLGLYIAKSILNVHNGELIISSEGRNKGTEVKLLLPV